MVFLPLVSAPPTVELAFLDEAHKRITANLEAKSRSGGLPLVVARTSYQRDSVTFRGNLMLYSPACPTRGGREEGRAPSFMRP